MKPLEKYIDNMKDFFDEEKDFEYYESLGIVIGYTSSIYNILIGLRIEVIKLN